MNHRDWQCPALDGRTLHTPEATEAAGISHWLLKISLVVVRKTILVTDNRSIMGYLRLKQHYGPEMTIHSSKYSSNAINVFY